MSDQKLFPLRLPPNFHGRQKPFRRLSQIYAERSAWRQDNPELLQTKISNWQVKRLDREVIRQRREFLVHPAKISSDTPDWFKTTLHHFHRSNYHPADRADRAEEMRFTVLNKKRTSPFSNTGGINMQHSVRIRREQPVAEKVGMRDTSFSSTRWASQREVTAKIGSVDIRDFSIPKTQIKIGQTHAHNFINTYQIA